jgi:hypothetical protein
VFVVLPERLLLLEEPLELSDNESSLELITDELSDSDELQVCQPLTVKHCVW